jgi:hypothetical protein
MQPMTPLQARYLADERLPLLNRSGKPIPGKGPQILTCLRDPVYIFAHHHPKLDEPRARTALLLLSNVGEPHRPDGLVQLNSNKESWPEHDNGSWWGNCTWFGSYHAGICTPRMFKPPCQLQQHHRLISFGLLPIHPQFVITLGS